MTDPTTSRRAGSATTAADTLTAAQARVQARRAQVTAERAARREQTSSALAYSGRISRLPGGAVVQGAARRGLSAWDVIKGREGTNPMFRVGQADAELLDEELLELLKGQVRDGLRGFVTSAGGGGQHDYMAEIALLLRAVLFKLSIWDHDASYGATLQGLKYTDARHKGSVLMPPATWQKVCYGLVTVTGGYAWQKWQDWLLDQEVGYSEPSPFTRRLSRLTGALHTTHSIAALFSFLAFLVNGRYRTLLDRILRMRLAPPANQISREVSFEYLNRQLVWHAFTEFLLFLLPLVGIGRWRRWLSRAWRRTKLLVKKSTAGGGEEEEEEDGAADGELGFLPERTCAICYQDQNPTSSSEQEVLAASGAAAAAVGGGGVIGSAQTDITNPYELVPCGHVYCFVCAASRLRAEEGEGEGWTCLRCGDLAKTCKPWAADVVDEVSRPSTSKSVRFENINTPEEDEDEDDFKVRELSAG